MLSAGRLSKDEIEKMVRDAEKFKDEDDKQRDRLTAKNALEGYAFNMKSTAEDEKLREKLSESDRKKILDKCNETIRWIDNNQVCSVDVRIFSTNLSKTCFSQVK